MSGSAEDVQKEKDMTVKMAVSGEQITLTVAYPFANYDL